MTFQQFIFCITKQTGVFQLASSQGKWKLKRDENSQRKKILGHLIQDFNKQLRRNQATNAQRERKSDVKKTSLTQDTPQRRRKV